MKRSRLGSALLRIAAALALIYVVMLAGVFTMMHMSNTVAGKGLSLLAGPVFMLMPMETMWCRARRGRLQVGQEAPDFELSTRDGLSKVRLSSRRGTRPIVLV